MYIATRKSKESQILALPRSYIRLFGVNDKSIPVKEIETRSKGNQVVNNMVFKWLNAIAVASFKHAETLLLTYILSFITYPSFKFTASNGCSNGDIETLGSISSIGKVGYEQTLCDKRLDRVRNSFTLIAHYDDAIAA